MRPKHTDQPSSAGPSRVSEVSAHPKVPASNTGLRSYTSTFLIGNARRLKNTVKLRKQRERYPSNRSKIPAPPARLCYDTAPSLPPVPYHGLSKGGIDANPFLIVTLAIRNAVQPAQNKGHQEILIVIFRGDFRVARFPVSSSSCVLTNPSSFNTVCAAVASSNHRAPGRPHARI